MGDRDETLTQKVKRLQAEIERLTETDRELRESEERLQAILDNAPVLVYIKDTRGRYRLINQKYEEVFRVDRRSLVGKTDYDVFSEEVAEVLQRNDRAVLESGQAIQFEEIVNHDQGPIAYISGKFPLRNASDEIYAICGISSDITERRKMEDALRESESRIRSINSELEAFTHAVSHDLRAPLRAIEGFSEALLEDYADKLDEEGRLYLNCLQEGCRDMGGLLNGLLELSRSTRGGMCRERVDLSTLAAEVADALRKAEPERQVTVKIADGIAADGDPRLLKVVLANLIGNAWKYTGRKAEACIEFGVTKDDEEGVVFIRDNGVGFDMAYQDKLFHAFQRLNGVAEFPGTGIGLATVQRIIHRHGGRIWARGELGRGATFFFTLGGRMS